MELKEAANYHIIYDGGRVYHSIAAAHVMKEAMWLHTFVGELMTLLSTIFCDNQVAITLSKDGQYHARTKHIDIHFHFIREAVENGLITLIYCPTKTMTTDLLTKPLNCLKTEEHTVYLHAGPPSGLKGECWHFKPCRHLALCG